ncbi:preprotein translocase subunit SecG [Hansschlegelia quercus]|uniref:Protein-export membrane protein SecG n=1 Tax=Hansschlegelia quercus TaxID=2528245 RepID=A0A4V2JEB2_9HYPH|nr:preprotein translocase subunit SecG [Hansschlegelia quercus]TBN54576.1 preprotein translocase subunit SecG [Hansschlegelia quercus]
MQTVLIVIHLMIVLSLVVVVLLQKSEGGALGIGGGGGFMAGRSQSNPLTRLTAYLAGGFFVTSMALTVVAGYGGGSVFDRLHPTAPVPQAAPGGPSAPLGTGQGGILQQLKQQTKEDGAGAPPQPSFAAPTAQNNSEPVPQPQGAAPITPQVSDPKESGSKDEVRSGPAQQTEPGRAGAEQTPANGGGTPATSGEQPEPAQPKPQP